jgi:hypothetical protein
MKLTSVFRRRLAVPGAAAIWLAAVAGVPAHAGPASPVVQITSAPADGSTNSDVTITFTASDADDTTLTTTCTFDTDPPVACTSPFDISTHSGQHMFTVTASDPDGNTGSASASWRNDTQPPHSTIAGVPVMQAGGSMTGSAADDYSGVATVAVTFVSASGGAPEEFDATVSCSDASRRSCSWTSPIPSSFGLYQVTSAATDEFGNVETPNGTVVLLVLAQPGSPPPPPPPPTFGQPISGCGGDAMVHSGCSMIAAGTHLAVAGFGGNSNRPVRITVTLTDPTGTVVASCTGIDQRASGCASAGTINAKALGELLSCEVRGVPNGLFGCLSF